MNNPYRNPYKDFRNFSGIPAGFVGYPPAPLGSFIHLMRNARLFDACARSGLHSRPLM